MKKFNLEKNIYDGKKKSKNKVKITMNMILDFLMVGSIGVAFKILIYNIVC